MNILLSMAFDQNLAQRVREALTRYSDIVERERMGGLTFMRGGKVCVRVEGNELVVRCRKEATDELLSKSGARRYEMKGKPAMKGLIVLAPEAIAADADFSYWLDTTLHRDVSP